MVSRPYLRAASRAPWGAPLQCGPRGPAGGSVARPFAPSKAPKLRLPLPFLPPGSLLCQLSSLIEASCGRRAEVNKCRAVNQELDWSRRGPA